MLEKSKLKMKIKTKILGSSLLGDMEENVGIVMPILTECDVDEDFAGGIEKVGETIPILALRNMVLFPGVAMPVVVGRPKSMRLIKDAAKKRTLIGVVCQKDMNQDWAQILMKSMKLIQLKLKMKT